ncbi:MAG: Ig-like domain-containing protein [bacterium]|nr:Ig-like domain-containing protein [bacterium]
MDKKLLWMSIILVLAFTLFASYVFFGGSLTNLARASEETEPSLQQSLIFAWPLNVPANGTAETEVTVFIRNNESKGLNEQQVKIASSIGTVKEGEIITDAEGKAVFHVSSSVVGVAEIEAFVDNKRLLRKISVQFE